MKLGNILKGCFVIILSLSLMMLTKTVRADVIWEPDDNFYLTHYQDCEHEGRNYTANGQNGYIIYESPKNHKKVENYANGTTFMVSFTYKDNKDVDWGIIESDGETGWVPMNELVLIYDNTSFLKDHKNEFANYQGELDDYTVDNPIILWTYPGSGVINDRIQAIDENTYFSYTYTDVDKSLWTFVSYHNSSNGWICISDPANENIPTKTPQVTVTIIPPSSNFSSKDSSLEDHSQTTILVILVVSLILVTACMIRVLYKKGRRE